MTENVYRRHNDSICRRGPMRFCLASESIISLDQRAVVMLLVCFRIRIQYLTGHFVQKPCL